MQITQDEQQADYYHLSGELCFSHIKQSKQQLLDILTAQDQNLKLDLADITDMDGAGLQLLLLLKHSADAQHKQLHLSLQNPVNASILETCQLQSHFASTNQSFRSPAP